MTDAPAPKNGRLTYWLLGALFAVVMLLTGGMLGSFNARLTDVEQEQRHRGDRLVALEASLDQIKQSVKSIETDVREMRALRNGQAPQANRP